jgi:hypothetical protein
MEKDIIIADIITNELQIDPTRVIVYGQNYDAPEDDFIYIVLKTVGTTIIGNNNRFDQDTGEETKSVSSFIDIEIEITSKNRDAYERKEEVLMALTSQYSVQKQEENGFKLFRTNTINDLTFIEGGSSLYRFNIPIRCTDTKYKVLAIEYFDKLRDINPDIQRR